jgi:hypothetical protein
MQIRKPPECQQVGMADISLKDGLMWRLRARKLGYKPG